MGLLDDLIGQLGNDRSSASPAPRTPASGASNMTAILAALAPIVLAMLNNRARAGQTQANVGPSGGGLGDILGQILGGARGGSSLGGLGDLLEQFQRAGFGEQARSWVSTGQNSPLPPGALEDIFGRNGLSEIARRAGLSDADTSRGLEQLLPEMVDHVTPGGDLPDGNDLAASVDQLTRRMGLS